MADISKSQLPEPYPATGGPLKTRFDESLFYITGIRKEELSLSRFHRFLLEAKGWSLDQIDTFLAAMADRWPPIEYPPHPNLGVTSVACANLWPPIVEVLRHPARNSLIQAYGLDRPDRWLDYGGFVRAELPALQATYSAWWKRQRARTDNLPRKKKNIQKVEKIPLTG
jgi:hypothetical protein